MKLSTAYGDICLGVVFLFGGIERVSASELSFPVHRRLDGPPPGAIEDYGDSGGGGTGGNGRDNDAPKNRNPLDFFNILSSLNITDDLEFVDATCPVPDYACRLAPRHSDSREDAVDRRKRGVSVCRTVYKPFEVNATRTVSICVPPDRAWESDDCGCCGDTSCPRQQEHVRSTCNNGDLIGDIVEPSTVVARRRDVVCRELFNPFTGEPEKVTLSIPKNKGREGDVCGCCDDNCPADLGRQRFRKPETQTLACEGDDLVPCRVRSDENEPDRPGVVACRRRTNPFTGSTTKRPVCIESDSAIVGVDTCGCCGDECPLEPPQPALRCREDGATSCPMGNGRNGVFRCRGMFHPQDGSVVQETLCVPDGGGWETDSCGCCGGEENCPSVPSTGYFASEDMQLFQLAIAGESSVVLEEPGSDDNTGGDDTGGDNSGGDNAHEENTGGDSTSNVDGTDTGDGTGVDPDTDKDLDADDGSSAFGRTGLASITFATAFAALIAS